MNAKRIAPVSAIVGLLTALLVVTGSNVGEADPPKRALAGAWLETVTFPPESGRPPLKALTTFHEDGTLTISDQGSVTTAGPMSVSLPPDTAFGNTWKSVTSPTRSSS